MHMLSVAIPDAFIIILPRPLAVLGIMSFFVTSGTFVRNVLVMVMALPALPVALDFVLQHALGTLNIPLICAHEAIVGLLIGFVAAIPFWAIHIAGSIIDTMRGASIGAVYNPSLGEQTSELGTAFSNMLLLVFVGCGGLHVLIDAIDSSYSTNGFTAALPFSSGFMVNIGGLWHTMFQLALQFSLPAIIVMVLIDLGMGLVNRAAPQLNVFFLALPIKTGATLLLLAVGMRIAVQSYSQHFIHFKAIMNSVLSVRI
jgi:type III secretion protein T